jgi:hypothetical protein
MPDFVLKYADGRGQMHRQVASASSEKNCGRILTGGLPGLSIKASG